MRTKHPRLGGLLLALAGEPQHQRAWATGSGGEKVVGGRLNDLVSNSLLVLHDRKMRLENGRLGGGNIDHLVIAPGGVWVVDSKEYSGSLEVRRAGGLFGPRVEQLWIAGRNRTKLVEDVIKQAEAVSRELAAADAPVRVHTALCFVGTDLPLFGSSKIGDVALVGRRGLRKLVQRPGPLRSEDLPALQAYLAGRFPPA